MKLIRKILKNKKKAEKRAKRTKKVLRFFGLCCAFCAGAACMGWFVYTHRNVLAAAVGGRQMPRRAHRFFCHGRRR